MGLSKLVESEKEGLQCLQPDANLYLSFADLLNIAATAKPATFKEALAGLDTAPEDAVSGYYHKVLSHEVTGFLKPKGQGVY